MPELKFERWEFLHYIECLQGWVSENGQPLVRPSSYVQTFHGVVIDQSSISRMHGHLWGEYVPQSVFAFIIEVVLGILVAKVSPEVESVRKPATSLHRTTFVQLSLRQ